MRALVVEDDPISGKIMQKILSVFGTCEMVADGEAALDAFQRSMDENDPYDLICMDIMMPGLSGQEVLKRIRRMEGRRGVPETAGVKVIMTTALDHTREADEALFKGGACAYFVKPIVEDKFIDELKRIGLISG